MADESEPPERALAVLGRVIDVGPVDRLVVNLWLRSRLYDWLRLRGYVSFNLPTTVSALGTGCLLGLVVFQIYIVTTVAAVPGYLVGSAVVVSGWAVLAAAGLWLTHPPLAPPLSWLAGDALSALVVAGYLATRVWTLPGLVAATGRWDYVPATWSAVCAAGFLAVHTTVLLGINVARPRHRQWAD